jgi:tetratricopeptide (TPR) repeat protein
MIKNIGLVYKDNNDFQTALQYLFRAREMFKNLLSNQHRDIAQCFVAIGYVDMKKEDITIDYYEQHLKMEEQCFPFDHPFLSLILNSIIESDIEFCQ